MTEQAIEEMKKGKRNKAKESRIEIQTAEPDTATEPDPVPNRSDDEPCTCQLSGNNHRMQRNRCRRWWR